MEFTLFYKGELLSNGNPQHKNEIRAQFHLQLQNLWSQKPLNMLEHDGKSKNFRPRTVGDLRFVSLVGCGLEAHGELNITLLRPGPPGDIVQAGDIDNRLKTLFDALTIPPHENAIPTGAKVPDGNPYYYCVFDDDKRITRLTISTDRYLAHDAGENDVLLLIKVVTTSPISSLGGMHGILDPDYDEDSN